MQSPQPNESTAPDGRLRTTIADADTKHFSRDALVQALDEVTWTAEKQARVIEGLERLVQQLQRDVKKERLLNKRSQKEMLNEQDQFIQKLIGEHEETVTKVVAERDEALRQIDRLEQLLPRSESVEGGDQPPSGGASGYGQAAGREVAVLREQLGLAKRRIGKLTTENQRSRDVLHRVMRQRDEAQLAIAQLMQDIRETTHRGHGDARVAGPSASPADASAPEDPTPSPAPETPGGDGEDDRSTPTEGAGASIRPSPLAIALASTHPKRRQSQPSRGPDWQRESTTLPGVAPEGRAQPTTRSSSKDERR
jgi:hypothetical protein